MKAEHAHVDSVTVATIELLDHLIKDKYALQQEVVKLIYSSVLIRKGNFREASRQANEAEKIGESLASESLIRASQLRLIENMLYDGSSPKNLETLFDSVISSGIRNGAIPHVLEANWLKSKYLLSQGKKELAKATYEKVKKDAEAISFVRLLNNMAKDEALKELGS